MVRGMDDAEIRGSIEALVAEEHELWQRESDGTATDADRQLRANAARLVSVARTGATVTRAVAEARA